MNPSELSHLPLEEYHTGKGGRLVPFAGWNMPVQYTSIIQEHLSVRKNAGLFDVSHMGEVWVGGREALAFLNRLLTNSFDTLVAGRSRYALMCAEDGGVVDDLIVYCLSPEEFLICVNASNREKDVAWMQTHARNWEVKVEDHSDRYGLFALQGPESEGFLQGMLPGSSLAGLRRFSHMKGEIAGVGVRVSRTGYTGGDGFELYFEVEGGLSLITAIEARADYLGLKDFFCGLGCRDSLRLEAGLPLYGHEISATIDPLTAGLAWAVKFAKPGGFIGKEALQQKQEAGLREQVIYFSLDDRRIAREGELVYSGDESVGRVLAGSYSPVSQRAIGSALVAAQAIRSGALEVRLRGNPVRLVPVSRFE